MGLHYVAFLAQQLHKKPEGVTGNNSSECVAAGIYKVAGSVNSRTWSLVTMFDLI